MNTLKNDGNYAKLAINKSLLKEYKTSDCTRTVYMNDGDEFQIQLFNPETIEIGAEIFIDDEPLSNIIILNPGERMWLERYTNKAKKFKFRVYTVDGDSKVVEQAIAHNGEIKIKFYRKKVSSGITIKTYEPEPYIYPSTPWTTIYCDTVTTPINQVLYSSTCDINSKATTRSRSRTTGSASGVLTATADTCLNFCSSNTTGDAAVCDTPTAASFQYGEKHYSDGSSCSWASTSSEEDNLIETGRVSEGSYSGQRFQTVNIDLEYWPFRTEEFKILPYSRKPFTLNDAKKLYCPNCGRKLNTKFKFCPYCGEKID